MTLRSARTWTATALAGTAGVLLAPSPAGAHTGHPVDGLVDGVLHPLTGPDHLLAMVAVGVLAAVTGGVAWWAPATFLGGMLAGGVAGVVGVHGDEDEGGLG